MIEVNNLNKSIQGKDVLSNISLKILPGETTVIMGPSGSGKSTLVRNTTLIDLPTSGTIKIDDDFFDFNNFRPNINNLKNLYPKVNVVFQQFFLWPHLTVEENIKLVIKDMSEETIQNLNNLYSKFDIDSILSKYPNEISVGQKQKVALVRSFILKPKYLFLDEITSALDIESTLVTLSYLQDLKSKGVGIVFVTHALHIAQKIADRVIVIENGKIVEAGTRDILFNPKTERLKKFIDTPIYT